MLKKLYLIIAVSVFLIPLQLSYGDYNSFTVNVPNSQGGYTSIVIKQSGNGYSGPRGEYYSSFPSVGQLQVVYGTGVSGPMISDAAQRENMIEAQADQANSASILAAERQQQLLDQQMQESIQRQNARIFAQQQAQQQANLQAQQQAQEQEKRFEQQQAEQEAREKIQQQAQERQAMFNHDVRMAVIVFPLLFLVGAAVIFRQQINFQLKGLPKISSGLFGIIILSFLLPWLTVSCANEKVVSLTGMELSFGKGVEMGMSYQPQKIQDLKVLAALVISITGLLAGFLLKEKIVKVFQTACGWYGMILLCIIKTRWDNQALTQGGGVVTVDYHFGFWAALLFFIAVGTINALSLLGIVNLDTIETIFLKHRDGPD